MKNFALLALSFALVTALVAQTGNVPTGSMSPYQPKSANDKAHSEAEFTALAYMRTTVVAEKLYHRKHDKYTQSLTALVGSGSFTRRMANPNRGDYTVSFRPKKDGYSLMLVPKQFDGNHRSFYVDETGQVRAEQNKPATEKSPLLA